MYYIFFFVFSCFRFDLVTVFFITDIDVSGIGDEIKSRNILSNCLQNSVQSTFNRISVDTDTSTSDTITIMSSNQKKLNSKDLKIFEKKLTKMCYDLSDDVVRNGEGVSHVMKCTVTNASSELVAVGVGKSVVNSPLLKCAVNGNDPNVGRLISSVGKYFSQPGIDDAVVDSFDPLKCVVSIGGITIFENGKFCLNEKSERKVMEHMKEAELYTSCGKVNENGTVSYIKEENENFPKHKKCVEIVIDLGMDDGGGYEASVLGSSLSHEYDAENADYRS